MLFLYDKYHYDQLIKTGLYSLIVYRIVNNEQHFYLVLCHWALHVQVPVFIRWRLISPVFWEEKLYSFSVVYYPKNTFFYFLQRKLNLVCYCTHFDIVRVLKSLMLDFQNSENWSVVVSWFHAVKVFWFQEEFVVVIFKATELFMMKYKSVTVYCW